MNWHSLQDFVAMGGYGIYVWGSFSAVFAVMALELLALQRRERQAQAGLARHDSDGAS